jgi:hypothetical protein
MVAEATMKELLNKDFLAGWFKGTVIANEVCRAVYK